MEKLTSIWEQASFENSLTKQIIDELEKRKLQHVAEDYKFIKGIKSEISDEEN